MADDTGNQQAEVDVQDSTPNATHDAATPSPPRRPYSAPQLRYLGKVAELTFGSAAGSHAEAGPVHKQRKTG
jgi:hypothetical protein